MKYITVGQASIDRSIMSDGRIVGINIGGPGVFAYTGIRLYDDDCQMILNTAEDFNDFYGEWIKKNKVNTDACYTCYDKTHAFDLVYEEDGSYVQDFKTPEEVAASAKEYGWTNVRPDQIARHTRNAKGLYVFLEPLYMNFWRQVKETADRNNLEVMYEIGTSPHPNDKERNEILTALSILKPEMASMNHNESSGFFNTEDKEEIFKKIYELNIPMFFYRAGNEGSYTLTNKKAYFIPVIDIPGRESIDPTGCGNSSTATAMWAWINTKNPVMTSILANITGGYNVSYAGVIKDLTKEMRKEAFELAIKYYEDYVKQHPEYVEVDGYEKDPRIVLKEVYEG